MPFFLIFWYLFQIWNVWNEIIIKFFSEREKERARKTFYPFLQAICITVAVLTQYFLMAALCWMLAEGTYFYLLIVKVCNVSNRLMVYHVMAWGMTFIIVSTDLPYFEWIYCWYDFTPTLTSRSLCVWRFPRHYGQHFSQHRNWKRRDSKLHQR